jgi:hypothetical protein
MTQKVGPWRSCMCDINASRMHIDNPCQATPPATWPFGCFCHTTAFWLAANRADGGKCSHEPTSNYAGCPASCINVMPCLTEACIINGLSCAHSPQEGESGMSCRTMFVRVRCRNEGTKELPTAIPPNALLSPPLLEYAVIRPGLPSVEAPDLCRWG